MKICFPSQFHSFDDDEENDEEDVPGLSRMDPMTFTDRGLVAVGPTTMRPNGGIYLPRLPQARQNISIIFVERHLRFRIDAELIHVVPKQ